jgi:hypothetical protein
MFGQGTFDWVPDFGGVVGFCVLDGGVGVVAGVEVVELVVAAEAPAIPAAAPPVASAPATIVAWSILDIRIGGPPGLV